MTQRATISLIAINDGGELENSLHEIYPAELELKKENQENTCATFLILVSILLIGRFLQNFFKRDDFPFVIKSRVP